MIKIIKNNFKIFQQIIKYLMAGGTAALVQLTLLYIFTEAIGIYYLISTSLAFVFSFFVSFFLQKFWTFEDATKEKMGSQMLFYLLIALTNLGLNALLMYFFVDLVKIWYMLAQVLVGAILAIESFTIYKLLIFNQIQTSETNFQKNNPAKVLIATGIFPPDYRGPATLLESLPAALREQGLAIKILTYSDISGSKKEQEEKGVYRISRQGFLGLVKHWRYFLKLMQLSDWAEVIYVTDLYSVGYFAYWLKKIFKIKYLIRFAGDSAWERAVAADWTDDYITLFQEKIYHQKIEKLKKQRTKILQAADLVIGVSQFMAGLAKKIGVADDKIKVIYNAIDFSQEKIDEQLLVSLKTQYGQKARIIVSAGQLVPWKGMAAVIRILPPLEEKIGQVNLLILGTGQELDNLKILTRQLKLEASVHFLGKIERNKMINYFKVADLFILNTNYEGLSHTLLEVMGAGVPIVTTTAGGNGEVIENNKQGILVEFNNQEQLASAALKILTDKKQADYFIAGAKEKLKKFNWADTVASTAGALKKVIYG